MMPNHQERYEKALQYLLKNEGTVYTDTPGDPGGPTKYGVTRKAYSFFLDKPVTPEEIAALTMEDIAPFYWVRYWVPLQCESIVSLAIATALFDTSVLYGTHFSVEFAQNALGIGLVDGHNGPDTLRRLNLVNVNSFLEAFYVEVLGRIDQLIEINHNLAKFRVGWTNRADRLLTLSGDPVFN